MTTRFTLLNRLEANLELFESSGAAVRAVGGAALQVEKDRFFVTLQMNVEPVTHGITGFA